MSQAFTAKARSYVSKCWVQWVLAFIFFLGITLTYTIGGINQCTTASLPGLGSDSTGGMAWNQWAGGNDLSWGATDKSNYPFGEQLDKPQYVTSLAFLTPYKVLSALTTPICGLNLIVMLGYLSSALVMFGFIRWLLKRFDIALLAGYAVAFFPFPVIKSQSHINYIYSAIFTGLIWAFFWLLSRPSYKRAAVLGIVSAIGFYFDGYYILFSSLLLSGLVGGLVVVEVVRLVPQRKQLKKAILNLWNTILKYLVVSGALLLILLAPIGIVFKTSSSMISQSLTAVRSNIQAETLLYGTRPIEFILPAVNNPILPDEYPAWRATKLHGSNYSESTLYIGYTVIVLAIVSVVVLLQKRKRQTLFRENSYSFIVVVTLITLSVCLAFSLPAYAVIFGHNVPMPTRLLIELTANWRTLSRIILVIQPIMVLLASFGLYWLTKKLHIIWKVIIVATCFLILFFEYLPSPFYSARDLYKDAPPIYAELSKSPQTDVVAEYPLAAFTHTPEIFTYQPVHNKKLVNANDGAISRGPFHAALAGLNDDQTPGGLQSLGVDHIVTHGFSVDNVAYSQFYPKGAAPVTPGSIFGYDLNRAVLARPTLLQVRSGYSDLQVDKNQISHRFIIDKAVLGLHHFSDHTTGRFRIRFTAHPICANGTATISLIQNNKTLWLGTVNNTSQPVVVDIANQDVGLQTKNCAVDITQMSAEPL